MARNARTSKIATVAATPAPTAPVTPAATPAPTAPVAPTGPRDVATYIPDPSDSDAVATYQAAWVARYRAADAKGKAAIRKGLDTRKSDAIDILDAHLAKMFQGIIAACMVTPAKAPANVNPLTIIADRVATLRLAADLLAAGIVTPDALIMGDATIIADWSDGLLGTDLPAGTADVDASAKIAGSKITRSTDAHDVGDYIARAFAEMPSGAFLSVAQIITRGAIDGDAYRPSGGAVTARLKGGANGCTVPGISGDGSNDAHYGGRKA